MTATQFVHTAATIDLVLRAEFMVLKSYSQKNK